MAASVDLNGLVIRSNGRKSSAPDFPLRANYFIPAKMPMSLIYPRPDGETPSHARHRNFHSQMTYEIPIGIQGGAWPFKYEILSSPAGATIGQYYGSENYGVISWTPSGQTGSQSFSVRVTDCDGDTFVVDWTSLGNDSAFVFVQKGYAGTKVGTITQPLEDIKDWYFNSDTDNTYLNKIIVFREGIYTATGNINATPTQADPTNVVLNSNYKTPSIVGFPGEVAEWDMSLAKLRDVSNTNDIFIQGITFKNGWTGANNTQFVYFTGESNRITFHRCKFKNMTQGLVGDDNTNPVFIAATTNAKNFFYMSDCEFDGIQTEGFNGGYVDIYRMSNICIERNTAKNCATYAGFWMKGTIAFVTLRANTAVDNISGRCFELGYGLEVGAGVTPHDHEVCWNNFRSATGVCMVVNAPNNASAHYNTFIYRNAIQGSTGVCRNATTDNKFIFDGNFLNLTSYASWDESIQFSAVIADIKSTAINSQGELTTALGFATHGWRPY